VGGDETLTDRPHDRPSGGEDVTTDYTYDERFREQIAQTVCE